MVFLEDFCIKAGADICKNCPEMELQLNETELPYPDKTIKKYDIECIHRRACEYVINNYEENYNGI